MVWNSTPEASVAGVERPLRAEPSRLLFTIATLSKRSGSDANAHRTSAMSL
jgi:hypothetical protein